MQLILFLDVDGVLNNTRSLENGIEFDQFNMACLKQLCDKLSPKIVLSSDWRRKPELIAHVRSELLHIGLNIFDTTPIIPFCQRKCEITFWLAKNHWDMAIIIDDMDKNEVFPEISKDIFFQRTDYNLGLTEENVDKILHWNKQWSEGWIPIEDIENL